jgi:hypothetical protein
MDFSSIFSDPASLVGSLLVIGGLIFFIVTENKKIAQSGLGTGEYINDVLLEGHIKWIIYLLLFISAAEALVAASIHPIAQALNPDLPVVPQHPLNVPARFITHLGINLGGTLMNIILPNRIVDLVLSFDFIFHKKKSNDPRYYMLSILKVIQVVWIGFAAFYIPYLNYMTIAQGLGELQMATWAIIDLFSPITGKDLTLVYQYYGYSGDLNPMTLLSYVMFAALGAFLVHMILGGYDGMHAVVSRLERDLESPEKIKGLNDDIKKFATNPTEGIKYLISKVGNARDRADAANIVSIIVSKFSTLTPQKRSRIAINLARFVQRWRTMEGAGSTPRNDRARRTLTTETKDFFRKSSTAGGLDRALSNRRLP